MRGFKTITNHFRYIRASRAIVASVFVLAMVLTAGVGVYTFNKADTFAADCSDNSIVRCGFTTYEGLTAAYDKNEYGDIRAIFDHYWIKRTLEPGTRVVHGVADNQGNIVAEGRVVANNAASIGRQQIMHSRPISIAGKTYYETSHVGGAAFKPGTTQLPALVVLDEAGNFKYAVLTDCGNPVYARPVPPPAPPKPEPKDIQVCDLTSKKIITIKEDQFDQSKHSTNLKDCEEKNIQVCVLATKKYPVTINEDEFDTKKHSTNPEDCKEAPKPKEIKVCDIKTKTWITISENLYDAKRHSTNQADCEVKPVPVPEKPAPTPPAPKPAAPTPVELPKTGAADVFGAAIGVTSMGLAAYYYAVSRRNG